MAVQVIPKVFYGVGFGSLTFFGGINSGDGALPTGGGSTPMPIAGTIRRMSVYAIQDRPTRVTITIRKNSVATGLSISLDGGAAGVSSLVAEDVTFVAGDYFDYRFVTNDLVTNPGFAIAVTVEIESSELIYGMAAGGGTVIATEGFVGGAFGNGIPGNTSGLGSNMGATYSLCPIAGVVDKLCMKRFTSQTGGAWTGYLLKNGILQDGSGGTVNTATVMNDSDPDFMVNTFSLSIAPTDRCSVLIYRSGSTASFGTHVAVGVAITADADGDFMYCGGSNDTIPNSGTTWKWVNSAQNAPTELEHTAYAGATRFNLSQIYVERSTGPGSGNSIEHRVLRNGSPSSITATVSDTDTSANGSGSRTFQPGDRLTLEIVNSTTVFGSTLHWGLAGSTVEEVPPSAGAIGEIAWVHTRRLVP